MKSKGFSLIEVLVAVMIFAGAIMVINNIWSGNFVRIRKARLMNEAALLLKKKMTEYEIKYAGRPLSEIPPKENGNFGSEHPNYSWEMVSREFEMPDLSSAAAGKEGESNQMMSVLIKTMTDFINRSVKEVKVTVKVKNAFNNRRKNKDLDFSVTTLFVDYQQDIALPGIGGAAGAGDENPPAKTEGDQ